MRKLLVLVVSFLFIFEFSQAQRWKLKRYEAVLGVGSTHIFGDIGGYSPGASNWYGLKDLSIGATRPSFYLGIRYKLAEEMALKTNFVYGRGYGSDEKGGNLIRNGSFSTSIYELSVQYEYYILREERKLKSSAVFNRKGMINNYAKTSFYAYGGTGLLFVSPEITIDPRNELADISNYKYNSSNDLTANSLTISGMVSIGLGVKYVINSNILIGFELGPRYALTDYVDGFSNAKSSKFNDFYYFGVASLCYKVRSDRNGKPILKGMFKF
ncbi:MAG: hypothetical protein HC896_13765 [Bacteroidales bacterium]|nr:hypothetical protein [Bacteroidales bacterium]